MTHTDSGGRKRGWIRVKADPAVPNAACDDLVDKVGSALHVQEKQAQQVPFCPPAFEHFQYSRWRADLSDSSR